MNLSYAVGVLYDQSELPHLNWSAAMFRKRRTKNSKQATEAGRDCPEVTADWGADGARYATAACNQTERCC